MGKAIHVETLDLNGNARRGAGFFNFWNIEPDLIVDIAGEVTDVPDTLMSKTDQSE